MKRMKFFSTEGRETMEFGFNDPIVSLKENLGWAVIDASGRTITLSGVSMLGYDDEIANSKVLVDFADFWKGEMNEAYKDSEKIMVVFTNSQVPVMLFHGKALKFIEQIQDLVYFRMDDKPIWVYKMNYLILSRK